MMTIIQRGSPERAIQKRPFRCQNCGAVWLADREDFRLGMLMGRWEAACRCPGCGAADQPEDRPEKFRDTVERAAMADEIAEQIKLM